MLLIKTFYYTALLNAVECSIHLNGPSQHYFHIIDRCLAYLTVIKVSGLFASDSCI